MQMNMLQAQSITPPRSVCQCAKDRKSIFPPATSLSIGVKRSLGTYQSVTVADSHRSLRHITHIPSENTVPVDTFLGLFLKVLLPFHESPRGHQPPVGPQAEVQFFPKHSDIEKQVLSRGGGGDRGRLGGTTGHPPLAAGVWGAGCSSGTAITFTSTSNRDHVRNVPAVGVCAEGHD